MATPGERLKKYEDRHIKKFGQQVTVTRKRREVTDTTTTRTLWCVPRGLSFSDANALAQQGGFNANEAQLHDFVFPGDTDMLETKDVITWDGWTWEVLAVKRQMISGICIVVHCPSKRKERIGYPTP